MGRFACFTLVCITLLALTIAAAADPIYIYGMHDPGGEYNMAEKGTKGWIVWTREIGSNPSDYSGHDYTSWSNAGYGVIVRLNNAYGSGGTLPYESQYANFAQRCKNYVAASPGVHYWIIGNECNLPREWPGNNNADPLTGEAITVARYVSCYNQCYTKMKEADANAKICPAPTGTWAPPYDGTCPPFPNRGIPGFIDYWVQCLNGIGASKISALIIHTYTHNCDASLIYSETKMGAPYTDIYYEFRVYKNQMWAIPSNMTTLPVLCTETNMGKACIDGQGYTWLNTDINWVENAYAEINAWNQANSQKIRCLALFRWPDVMEGDHSSAICVRPAVITDWRQAMDQHYVWTTAAYGTIAGTVKDSGGVGISGATVSTTTGGYSTTTNSSGAYTLSNVEVGTYSVVASKAGYNTSTLTGKTVNGGQTTTCNFTLTTSNTTNLLPNAAIYLECGHNETTQRGKSICDGNLSTKWCCLHNGISTAGDHWLAFDLGNSATVSQFVVKHASMGGEGTNLNTKTFYIESASSLMGPWTQEFYVDNSTTVSSNTLSYGTPKALRYIRLRVTKPNPSADWAVRIPEFEVWGTAGTAQAVKVEVENFDRFYGAVDGTQYHDAETTNQGGQYRTSGVDIETCSEGTYNVGWTGSGEWLLYPWCATNTSYTLTIRHAGTSSGTVRLFVDGVDKTGAVSLPSTGGWQTWATKDAGTITVTTGWHDIKLQMDSGGFNINYFTLTPGGNPPSTGIISGNVKDGAGANVSGATVTTTTGGYTTTTDSSGNYTLSNVTPATYSVVASKTGYNSQTQTGKTVNAGATTTCNFTITRQTGAIAGNVKDGSGVNVSGATVSTTTGGYTTTTNSSGNYTLSSVDTGTYSVVASKTGYNSQTQTGNVVNNAATTTVNFTITAQSSTIASESFDSMPSWSSSNDASWGSAASWAIVSGGQSGNCLQASRTSQGSSAKVKVYTVPQNTNITISIYMKCPSYAGGSYWMETAYRLGNYSASNYDSDAANWTLIKKFNTTTNGNNNTWTNYSVQVNTGSNTQISIGYKHGASGCVGPTTYWDTFLIQ